MKVVHTLFAIVTILYGKTEASGAASAAANAGLKALDYRYFVAGGVCAATSHGITTPIDVVKTKMQARPDVYNKGIYEATVAILNTEGPSALLGGLGPTVVGYGIEGAMKFGVYEVMKPVMAKVLRNNLAGAYIAASIIAGAVASVLLCPMESARIRVVTDDEFKGKSMLETLPKLISEGGLLSLFGGLYAMLSKQVPYTMAKQVSFDVIAGLLYSFLSKNKQGHVDDLKWMVSVLSAFFASIFACIFSQPGDMILTETYKGKSAAGFFGVISDIYRTKGGVSGFFTGTGARILHVSTIITSQLVIYDIVKQLLGLPATGSH
jgi:solute carrier family 25 phosphate transporter 3